MYVYPIFFTVIGIIAILWLYYRFKNNKYSLLTFLLWSFLWIMLIVFAIIPNFSNIFAKFFGITRGLDFIFIVSIIGALYLILKLYFRLEKLQESMNKIVKELAIKNEISIEDEEE